MSDARGPRSDAGSGSDTLDAVVHGAGELVVGPREGATATGGRLPAAEDLLDRYEDGAVAVVDGRVAAVGPTDEVTREYPPENAREAVDADGGAVIPGFVDSHTHALFAGDRSDEFEAKLRGTTYQEISAEGGGILRTVRAVRAADDEELLSNLLGHLDRMLAAGTTTVEVKSGYGLDVETELRMLSVIDEADDRHPVDVVPTFMGAHAVPEGPDGDPDADAYVDRVVDEQIPAVAEQGIAEFCDVFCEEGVFSVEGSRRVLEAGAAAGMTPKVHAEELAHVGGTELAAEVGAASADHLLHATEADRAALRETGVTPVLLPGTAFGLGAEYADARAFLDGTPWADPGEGVPLAVATDFNPNCYAHSMGFAASLSCVEMGTTPAEALLATTAGGAEALDLTDGRGTLRAGAPADLTVLSRPSHRYVAYDFDGPAIEAVIKGGRRVIG